MKAKSKTVIFKKYHALEELTIDQKGKEIKRERIVVNDAVAAVVYDINKKKYNKSNNFLLNPKTFLLFQGLSLISLKLFFTFSSTDSSTSPNSLKFS